MNVAVVIVTYNNSAATLAACLDALGKQTLQPTRTLVIDNASPQGFPEQATANRHNIEVIRNNENVGFAAANNQAFEILAREGNFELVALLNPDAFAEPGWLAELVSAAEQYPEFDAFASRMMVEGTDNIVDGMGDAYHITGLAWREGHGTRLRPTDLLGREVFGVCAGAGLYRLAALTRVCGFDEGLFCYLEDVDLSFRMRRAGMRCRYVPNAVVWHVGGQSSQDNAAFRLYYGHRNMIRVYLKNMPAPLLLLTLPGHVVVNIIGIVRSLWRGDATTVLRAKVDAFRSIGHVWGQRRELRRSATVGARPLWRYLSKAPRRRSPPLSRPASRASTPDQSELPYSPPDSPVHASMLGALIPSKLRRFTSFIAQGEFIEAFWYVATRIGIHVNPPPPLPRAGAVIASPAPVRSERVTIAACTHSLSLEGAPISLLEILVGLVETSRYEIHLISPNDGELSERARAAGIHIHIAASAQDRSVGRRSYEAGIAQYARELSAVRADVLIANCVVMFRAVDAARSLGIPSLWVIREEMAPQSLFSLYPRAVQRRALACIDYPAQMIFLAESTLNKWPAAKGTRVLIPTVPDRAGIANLVASWTRADARKSLGITDDEVAVLTIGTLCANKGQLDLVGAARVLEGSPIRVLFVGTPAALESDAIFEAISRLPAALQKAIEVHPVTPDIGRYYAAADIYVCSSRSESYPRTILEALAFGLPIVTTLVGGIPEALAATQVQAFKPGDIEALGAALRRVIRSGQLKSAMSESSSRRWADLAQQTGMVESYVHAINRALGTNGHEAHGDTAWSPIP